LASNFSAVLRLILVDLATKGDETAGARHGHDNSL